MPLRLAEFQHENIRVVGFSLAGEESFFVLPELNLAFDVGRAQRQLLSVDHVFLTHGHMDHAAGIAYYFSQRMFIDNQPGHLYAPEPLVEPIRRLLRLWADIDGHEPPSNVHPAVAGTDIALRRDLVVRPFEVNHPCRRSNRTIVRSLGYAAIEVRQKLLPEYQELTGPQLVLLKQQGTAITRRVELPQVAYCGDTAPGDFFDLPCVRDAKVLLLECTFVEPDHRDRARAGCHIHISQLRDIIPRLNSERIVLTHLSRRTSLADARAMLRRELGELYTDRITFLMEHRRRHRRGRPEGNASAPPTEA
ncbi:MAG: MBL fold metallo-hydrolase [Phycisphaerae bacterium]|jgi:ribonuclease Z